MLPPHTLYNPLQHDLSLDISQLTFSRFPDQLEIKEQYQDIFPISNLIQLEEALQRAQTHENLSKDTIESLSQEMQFFVSIMTQDIADLRTTKDAEKWIHCSLDNIDEHDRQSVLLTKIRDFTVQRCEWDLLKLIVSFENLICGVQESQELARIDFNMQSLIERERSLNEMF